MGKLKNASLIGGSAIIVAAIVVTALEITNTTHIFHDQPATKVATTSQKNTAKRSSKTSDEPTKDSGPTDENTGVPPSNDTKYPTAPTADKKLITPQGTFANEYNVTMSEQMASNCVTNSGVYCQIMFTKGNVMKMLPKQSTDASGNTSWVWTPKSIGLTPGTWHIKAVASYNGQTKTANNDPLTLNVKS